MSTRTHLHHAADELAGLLERTSGAPWRLSDPSTDGARYRALVATTPTAERAERAAAYDAAGGPGSYSLEREREDYGGYLVAETCAAPDRELMATMRNAAEHLPDLLRAIAAEDPHQVGTIARRIAAELCPCDDHDRTPR